MPIAGPDRQRAAFAFIDEVAQLREAEGVVSAMERVFAGFGFDNLLLTGLPEAHFDEGAILGSRWPAEFTALYIREQYNRVDPLARLCRRSAFPFVWSAEDYFRDPNPRSRELMQRAADFGLTAGFIVPIHGSDGYEAAVSVIGRALELSRRNKAAIHLMALYGFERVCSLRAPPRDVRPHLSPREREVLAWAAQGKSAWEIGEILHIAKRTVDEHAQHAFHKLGAANRTQAVAIALRDHLIEP
jgi:LuxR family quorum sensing-dependent transcriptional regulator